MPVDLTSLFASYLARNRGPVPGKPELRAPIDYGVAAALRADVVVLGLTFRSGAAYCCMEPGCHLSLLNGQRESWEQLRRDLGQLSLTPPIPLTLRVVGVVEAGAMFCDMSRPRPFPEQRGFYHFKPHRAFSFWQAVTEPHGDEPAKWSSSIG